jgi:2-dehydro-3-deoxyphosphogalactonate aldolase
VQAFEEVEHYVIGRDPFDVEQLRGDLYEGGHFFHVPGIIHNQVLAALDIACWDIMGKAVGKPIYKLLGGQVNETVRTYTYAHYQLDRRRPETPEAAADAAEHYVDMGFTGIKLDPVRPGVGPREVPTGELDFVEDVFAAIREAVGEQVDICVGTHGQLHTQEAIRLARRIEPFDPLWFEEPVPPEDVGGMARVANATSVPIATGERLPTKFHFADIIEADAASILQLNVGMVGMLESKKIASMAETHYRQIAPWMYCGPIHGAASLQLDACSRNFLIQESIEDWEDSLHNELLVDGIDWHDGYITVPDGPGLGFKIDEDVLTDRPIAEPAEENYISPRQPGKRFRP